VELSNNEREKSGVDKGLEGCRAPIWTVRGKLSRIGYSFRGGVRDFRLIGRVSAYVTTVDA